MADSTVEFYYNKRVLFVRSALILVGYIVLLMLFYNGWFEIIIKGNKLIGLLFLCGLFASFIFVYLLYFKRLFQIKPAFSINNMGIHCDGKTFFWNEIHDVSCSGYYAGYKDSTPVLRFYTEKKQKHQIFLCLKYTDYQKVFDLLKNNCTVHKISYSNRYVDEAGCLKNIRVVWQQVFDIILLMILLLLLGDCFCW